MQYSGLLVGCALFATMFIARWMCIKGEYYFGKKFCIVFAILGFVGVAAALFIENIILSSILSIIGFVSLWGIHETIEQTRRVKKGWFPKRKK